MLVLNLATFPELRTRRLLLRRMAISDAPEILFLRSNKQVMQYIDREPAQSITDAEEFIKLVNANADANIAIQWGISMQDQPARLIGGICLWHFRFADYRAEVGYSLHPDFWRKGIMKEALQKVLDFGFTDLGLHSIEAMINPGNMASAGILESTGFKKEAHFKEDYFFRGKFLDTVVYSIVKA